MGSWSYALLLIILVSVGLSIAWKAEARIMQKHRKMQSLSIRKGVRTIRRNAYRHCELLESVHFPETLHSIEMSAFRECGQLQTLKFGERLVHIDLQAFFRCTALQELYLPDSVKTLGDGCFMFCTGLKTVKLSQNLRYIGNNAFFGCPHLKELTIPEHVQHIGKNAFGGSTGSDFYILGEFSRLDIAPHAFTQHQRLCCCRKGRKFSFQLRKNWASEYEEILLAEFLKHPNLRKFAELERGYYKIPLAVGYYDIDETIRNYLRGYILTAAELYIRNPDIETLTALLQDGFITAEHIDSLIETAIQAAQSGGSLEIQAMLMDYKAEHFGFVSIEDRFRL